MVTAGIAILAALSGIAAAAQVPPPPPPPVIHGPVAPAEQRMTVWRAGAATCAGASVAVSRMPNPLPSIGWSSQPAEPLSLTFRIDATGRPVDIRRGAQRYVGDAADVLPAMAAARFATGAARDGCSIAFTAERVPIDAVPPEMAMAYTVFPTGGPPPEALWQRVRPVETDCINPAPALLNRAYPDFTKVPGEPGRPIWSMVGYDIDAGGRPVHVRTVSGSQSAALDAASRRAVGQSRFGKGARKACLYPYWKIADPLPAPEAPPRETFPVQPEACKALGDWARAPRLAYPENYRRRGVEGWAIVSYDVAPWGQLGNVTVLAAEPTSDFGDAAKAMFGGVSRQPSKAGATGCIDRVRYMMGKPGTPPPPPETGPQPLY